MVEVKSVKVYLQNIIRGQVMRHLFKSQNCKNYKILLVNY